VTRLALVSVGIGRVQRGFERYFRDLFGVLQGRLDVTLFKSAGARTATERVPPLLRPATALARRLPAGRLLGREEYKRDCVAFAACMLPILLRERYEVVHVIDPPLAHVLSRLRRGFRLPSRLLFTEGARMPPSLYPSVDHVHHVARAAWSEAQAAGVPAERLSMIPCGLDTSRFSAARDRAVLRSRHQVPAKAFVVLVVSAVKREHKRVDHVIEEVALAGPDVLLWIDGHREDPEVERLASDRLGDRCRITHVPSDQVPELYRLADVLVHAALEEAFGLAVVEAMCSGLRVLVHDSPHFEWLVGSSGALTDMKTPGALATRLRAMVAVPARQPAGDETGPRDRFDWQVLAHQYVEMYEKVARLGEGAPKAP
jgi:glycosyltransferase involved in cell wall biosynthesis